MADQHVGCEITRWLLARFPDDVAVVVTTAENAISTLARAAGVACFAFESDEQTARRIDGLGFAPDLGILAWWPAIVRQPLLGRPRKGFINTHPSLLPHNRGKHYNFWALVEQSPFGVSLHVVADGVDSGDIVAQAPVPYDWEDTGGTLYAKAGAAMIRLFEETYPRLRTLDFPRRKQDLSRGSFHLAAELDRASLVDLDRQYRARDLLNLLRARTFAGQPACRFAEGDAEYEVRIEITRKRR